MKPHCLPFRTASIDGQKSRSPIKYRDILSSRPELLIRERSSEIFTRFDKVFFRAHVCSLPHFLPLCRVIWQGGYKGWEEKKDRGSARRGGWVWERSSGYQQRRRRQQNLLSFCPCVRVVKREEKGEREREKLQISTIHSLSLSLLASSSPFPTLLLLHNGVAWIWSPPTAGGIGGEEKGGGKEGWHHERESEPLEGGLRRPSVRPRGLLFNLRDE